jgi:sugar lactone lactonase YvrE
MPIHLAFNSHCLLGESPVWSPLDQSIYFIDIKKLSINRFCIADGLFESIPTPSEIGCIVLKQGGGIVAAMQSGLAFVDFTVKEYSFFCNIDGDIPTNRPNDGKCDGAGRLWIASMDNNEVSSSGRLWRISSTTVPKIVDSNFVVGNGVDWSPDSKTMYFTDSVNRTIYAYDFDLENGTICNKQVFAIIPESDGFPDGLIVDSQGFIWSAHWDGWRVTRYAPSGSIDRVINLPVPRPTSLAFGGANLSSLFITSASYGLTSAELMNAPLSGGLFIYNSTVSGRLSNQYLTGKS